MAQTVVLIEKHHQKISNEDDFLQDTKNGIEDIKKGRIKQVR